MIGLVLERARREAADLSLERVALPIPAGDAYLRKARDHAAQIRHAQAPFVVVECLAPERLDHGVDDDRERHIGLVWITGVVLHLDGEDAPGDMHLRGREPRAV